MNSIERLETAFLIVGLASLKANNEPTDKENIEYEAYRIERCVEYFYVKENHDLHYLDYATKFLRQRYNDIVHRDKYLGDWMDDVQHVGDGSSVTEFRILI